MKVFWQYLIPQHVLSRIVGYLAQSRWPWLKNQLIRLFIARYAVKMSEAISSDPFSYPTFNDFFTRALKPELRPIASDKNVIISPVDGCISQSGSILQGSIFQAKGFDFSVEELIADNERAAAFTQGSFMTLYLAPADYHRVHMPFNGRLTAMTYIPGQLFSVNQESVRQIPRLFARNERLVTFFDTEMGKMAVVLVGAMIVAGIETVWSGLVTPGGNREIVHSSYENSPLAMSKGDEMGRFRLGSTVLVLFANPKVQWLEKAIADEKVNMGQAMGLFS